MFNGAYNAFDITFQVTFIDVFDSTSIQV